MATVETAIGSPEVAADSFAANLATQERQRQEALEAVEKLRKQASAEVERPIAFLDASDGYTTTEMEPSLDGGTGDDREAEPEHDEPELASFDRMTDQSIAGASRSGLRSLTCRSGVELDTADDQPSLSARETAPVLTKYMQPGQVIRDSAGDQRQ